MITLNIIGRNVTELHFDDLVILFSYNTPVACRIWNKGIYKTNKKFSRTTSKHINQWLEDEIAEEKEQEFFDNLLENK